MKNQENNQLVKVELSNENSISLATFDAIKNFEIVIVEPKYYNVAELFKKGDSDDIIITAYKKDGFVTREKVDETTGEVIEESKVMDCIEFMSKISGQVDKYIYSGAKIVGRVRDICNANGVLGGFALRIKYLGKTNVKGKNISFDDFEILGLKNNE